MRPPKPPASEAQVDQLVRTAFNDAQRTTSAHRRSTKLLLSAFTASPAAFFSSFIHCLNRALLVFSRQPAVERFISFVALFTANADTADGNFRAAVLAYLLEQMNATAPAVRFRSVQLLAATLNALPEDAEISEELWEPLQIAILSRAYDRVPRVRAAAAAALCRLQITGNPTDDPFAARLVKMVSEDSSAAVRKAALQAVALSEKTIPVVSNRTKDIRADVRRVAYETLALKVQPTAMETEDLCALLHAGLADRDASVRKTCTETMLLAGWLDGACEGNIFALCELLGCNDREEDVLRALRVVFASERHKTLIDAVQIDLSAVQHADVLVLRAMADTQRGEAFMDKFFANTIEYTNVIQYYSVDDFASRHLLELCKSVDMGDEAGRKALENVVRTDFLSSHHVSDQTVAYAVRAMRRAMLDEEATLRILLEIVRQDILADTIDENEDGTDAEAPSDEDREWRNLRALNVVKETLRICKQGESSAAASNSLCRSLMEVAVVPQLLCVREDIRQIALECLGLFCLLDRSGTEAKTNMPLFIQASKTDVPSIQELTSQVLVDFLMVFDFSTEQAERNGDGPDASFSHMAEMCVDMLSENLTHADGCMRSIAVQGLSRLLFVRRITPNPTLLSRMLIVHHNPTTEDDAQLRQCLSVFFPAFAMSAPANRLGLEDSFKQTCRILTSAPSTSPLSTIPVLQVAQFIVHLTNATSATRKQGMPSSDDVGRSADQIHERLAETVLHEIIDAVESDEINICRIYGRILTGFRLTCTSDNQGQIQILRKLAQSAMEESDDKRLTLALKRFRDRMTAVLDKAPAVVVQENEANSGEQLIEGGAEVCSPENVEADHEDAHSAKDAEDAEEEVKDDADKRHLSGDAHPNKVILEEASEVTAPSEVTALSEQGSSFETGMKDVATPSRLSLESRSKPVEDSSEATPRRRSTRLSNLRDSIHTSRTDVDEPSAVSEDGFETTSESESQSDFEDENYDYRNFDEELQDDFVGAKVASNRASQRRSGRSRKSLAR